MNMDQIHNVFHVALLCKHINDLTHMLKTEDMELEDNLIYEKHLIQILDRWIKQLKGKQIPPVKVLWRNHLVEEPSGQERLIENHTWMFMLYRTLWQF